MVKHFLATLPRKPFLNQKNVGDRVVADNFHWISLDSYPFELAFAEGILLLNWSSTSFHRLTAGLAVLPRLKCRLELLPAKAVVLNGKCGLKYPAHNFTSWKVIIANIQVNFISKAFPTSANFLCVCFFFNNSSIYTRICADIWGWNRCENMLSSQNQVFISSGFNSSIACELRRNFE